MEIIGLGLGDGSVAKSTVILAEDPGFDSQCPHDNSQTSVIQVPGDLKPSSGLCGWQACTRCTDRCAGKISTHIKLKQTNLIIIPEKICRRTEELHVEGHFKKPVRGNENKGG